MTQALLGQLQSALGDRYAIEREHARGGMATVYLAIDRRHGRRVALKVLDANVAGALGVGRFLREIQIAARLTHPHIVPLYESGEADGMVFYTMPFITGESLRERLARAGPMPLADVARIARELASALDYAHRAEVVHRDIKPENILLSEGHAVIADFGIARAVLEAATGSVTQTGIVVGTPAYMSPEQIDGQMVDGRADQYALACVLYELLAGHAPFDGKSAMALMAQHAGETPRPLRTTEPVPESAERAIMRALAKQPSDRFSTVGELADALSHEIAGSVSGVPRLPAVAPGAHGQRIPVPLTRLIGRDRDVQTIVSLLQRESVRLLTLHGPGGIGKTRLAIEVASQMTDRCPHGVWFVALTEARDAESFNARVAQALGLRGAATSGAAMREYLRDRRALLVLDNFEQLVDAASEITSILSECPEMKVLVTSQVSLRVYGEHEFQVEPLPVPDPGQASNGIASDSAAVQLFVERATAARADFVLDAGNAAAVAEICARLDGVPLAIELAAARVRHMPPQTLLPKLANALDVLTGGARDMPARQRTMRNAIAWCHELLNQEERAIFRRLSIFAGGATAAAAAAVRGDVDESAAIEDALASLVDRSLLRQQIDAAAEPRYYMLRPIHEFAARELEAAGESEEIADRHAVFFRGMALESEAPVARGDEVWLDRLEADRDNLRLALERLSVLGRTAEVLRIGVALWRFWEARSYAREGLEWLSTALDVSDEEVSLRLRLGALYAAGILADSCGEFQLGRRLFEEHLSRTEELNDPRATSISRNNLAILLLRHGEVDAAIPHFESAVERMGEVGNTQAAALGLANLGNAERIRGHFDAARKRYEQSLAMFESIHDRVNVAWSMSHLGDLARDEGDVLEARTRYRQSLSVFAELQHKRGVATVLIDLGELAGKEGSLLEARGLLEEALVNFADLGDQRAMTRVFEAMAGTAAAAGQDEHSVRLAGAVAGLRDRIGTPLLDAGVAALHRRVSAAIDRLGPAATEEAWAKGLAMTMQEVVQYVTAPAGI